MSDDANPLPGLSQSEIDNLLSISGLTQEAGGDNVSLVDQIKEAVLDSGRLNLNEWSALRDRLKEIEQLIPHIDLIIKLKQERRKPSSANDRLRRVVS